MAVTINERDIYRTGPNQWIVYWTSGLSDPVYRVFIDRRYVRSTRVSKYELALAEGEVLHIQVLDDANACPQLAISPRVKLTWDAVTGTDLYRVEQNIDGEWVRITLVMHNDTVASYAWVSPVLAGQVAAYPFRVISVGTNRNESDPLDVNIKQVRQPDPPVLDDVTFNTGPKTVTIAIAA